MKNDAKTWKPENPFKKHVVCNGPNESIPMLLYNFIYILVKLFSSKLEVLIKVKVKFSFDVLNKYFISF